MSVKIRLSYKHPEELEFYLRVLKDHIKECKLQTDKEPYSLAYLTLKDPPHITEHR